MPADIVIYAIIAVGLVLWLRNVLGIKHGDERERQNPFSSFDKSSGEKNNVYTLPGVTPAISGQNNGQRNWSDGLEKNMDIQDGLEKDLTAIAKQDRSFDLPFFMRGAQDAFVYIIEALSHGDRDTLRNLLAPPVYKAFESVINQREKDNVTASAEIHAIRQMTLQEAFVKNQTIYMTVRFVADETNVLKDKKGKIIEGNQDKISETIDIWTFGRKLKTKDPAWLLYQTQDEDAIDEDHKTVPDAGE